jgi:tetratricopeptide (TPR) repeat protein
MKRYRSAALLAPVVLAIVGLASPVTAGEQAPLEGKFKGDVTVTPLTPPFVSVDVEATGKATLLGKFTLDIPHVVNRATRTAISSYVFTAANGDKLTADFTGTATNAASLLSQLVLDKPNRAEHQRDLAASYGLLGLIYFDEDHLDKADAAYLKALAIQEKLVEASPTAAEHQFALARTYSALGLINQRADRPEDAANRSQQAQNVLSQLVQNYPLVAEYQSLLASTQLNLGQVFLMSGVTEKAEIALKDARSLYGKLVQGQKDVPAEYLQSLARSNTLIGVVYKDGNQVEKAEAAQQEALEIFQKVAQEHPANARGFPEASCRSGSECEGLNPTTAKQKRSVRRRRQADPSPAQPSPGAQSARRCDGPFIVPQTASAKGRLPLPWTWAWLPSNL